MDAPPAAPRTALQTTLDVASSAANLVLRPYVVAGRAAYQATSFAVTAPIKVTKHVANTISGSWQPPQQAADERPPVDLFGEHEAPTPSVSTPPSGPKEEEPVDVVDAPLVEGVLFESEAPVQPDHDQDSAPDLSQSAQPAASTQGVVSQLIFLPIRFVSSSVASAATLPASAISFGGRTLSGAVSTSQSLASSALVASGGLALRTSRHVASGLTHGAVSTAHRMTGLVGSSVRTASYVIPPSVSNALWQGMEKTGSVSTNVISYAIAVPSYRMAQALIPELGEFFTEQQLVDTTKDGVKLLVKVLGPQNAFYVLKFMYEIVNSEEVYDTFLLCQDLVRESLDADNYKKAGSSVSKATGLENLTPVIYSIYEMMPSMDEIVDAAFLVGEVVDEIAAQVAEIPVKNENILDSGRFELVLSEDEDELTTVDERDGERSSLGTSMSEPMTPPVDLEAFAGTNSQDAGESESAVPDGFIVAIQDESSDEEGEVIEDGLGGEVVFASELDNSSSREVVEDPLADVFNSSMSFFSSVLDSEEASMLLNTFGDFLDVLVD